MAGRSPAGGDWLGCPQIGSRNAESAGLVARLAAMSAEPWLRRDRLAEGIPRSVIDGDVRARRTVVPFRGVHMSAFAAGRSAAWRAALLTQAPTAVLSHPTAAVAHTLSWLPDRWFAPDAVVYLTVPSGDKHRQRPGLRRHEGPLARDVEEVFGCRVLSVARTLVDLICARMLDRPGALAVVDGALRDGRCTPADLEAVLSRFAGRRGIRRAREIIGLARLGIDSPGESALRLALVDGGVPDESIDVGLSLRDDDGMVACRSDLGSAALMLWGEYDGRAVHSDPATFAGDRRSDRWLERRGWHVMRFVAADLKHPERVANEWLTAMRNAPARILAMDPGRSPELARAQRALRMQRFEAPSPALTGCSRRARRSPQPKRPVM